MTIRRLDSLLVNQIAAGEVVDRPASVVKELVENALDAGATRVDVHLERGGRDLMRIADNGSGIAADELLLAVAAHATSKIAVEADLQAIGSLGFRGEALASIGAVSRLTITSRIATEDAGATVEVDGGSSNGPRPAGCAPGTVVEVKRLFFNTPARRKFLKSDAAETTRVREVINNLAVAHADVSFSLCSNDRMLLELPAMPTPRQRLVALLGAELEDELLEVEGTIEGCAIWGLVGCPQLARPTRRHLRICVNGRAVADASISHALREAFRGLMAPGRWPTAAIFLEMDPAMVDVNVHPRKSEVRFRDRDAIWHLVHASVAAALRGEDLVPTMQLDAPSPPLPADREFGAGAAQPSTVEAATGRPLPTLLASDGVLQVHKCFLVTQDEEGLLIVDQHALHERVMFEDLMERISRGPLEAQRMLVPDVIEATAGQLEAMDRHAHLLERLGIDAVASGPATISLHAVPTLLISRNVDAPAFICDLLDRLASDDCPSSAEAMLSDVLDMMACKAAVKAGDRLSPEELGDLLERGRSIERGVSCPHGRPTTFRLGIEELERRFGRR